MALYYKPQTILKRETQQNKSETKSTDGALLMHSVIVAMLEQSSTAKEKNQSCNSCKLKRFMEIHLHIGHQE